MASSNTNVLSQDIFLVTDWLDKLKAKYINIPEDTLFLGVYGWLSSVLGNLIQNTATMVSEYALEAIPTRAKYERNVIAHALTLGLERINAVPAQIPVQLCFPEDNLVRSMVGDKLVLDKDFTFYIGDRAQYPYHLDYDIILKRNVLPNGKIVYTALYDLDGKNPLASLSNPYLSSIGRINSNGQKLIAVHTTLRQTNHTIIHKAINVDNPLETKTMTFTFEDQLSHFYVEVTETTSEGTKVHYLKPIYEGLYDFKSNDEYINYMYLDEKTIRLKFNRGSYFPRRSVDIDVHVFTTLGATCNYELEQQYKAIRTMTSERYSYNALYTLVVAESGSMYGEDKMSIEALKEFIPREALARGSISTYTDLLNYFNIIQTEDCKMKIMQRVHNQVEHVYFSYLLMKCDGSVIPTNTIDTVVNQNLFHAVSKDNYIIKPGSLFFLEKLSNVSTVVDESVTEEQALALEERGWLYTCPYLIVINKNPFYVSYYNVFVNYSRTLYYEFINDDSNLQFVAEQFTAFRHYFDNETNEFHIQVALTQNINTDYNILTYSAEGRLEECNILPMLVFYTKDADGNLHAYRYIVGNLIDYNQTYQSYFFDFCMTTNNVMAGRSVHMLFNSGCRTIGTGEEAPSYLEPNVDMKLFVLVKEDVEYGRNYGDRLQYSADSLFPNLDGYTLTNIYNAGSSKLDIYYDYSDIMNSYISLDRSNSNFVYDIYKVPVVRHLWLQDEDRLLQFFRLVDYRRRYIQDSLFLLEDSFGINFKLFNTYGPSKLWNIEKEQTIDRVNLSLKFEIKFLAKEEVSLLPEIEQVIKTYVDDFNTMDTPLHMPNCCTYVKNLYNGSLEYIKFVGLNDYGNVLWQSIYENPIVADDYFTETQIVPEFININQLPNGLPDIEFDVKE